MCIPLFCAGACFRTLAVFVKPKIFMKHLLFSVTQAQSWTSEIIILDTCDVKIEVFHNIIRFSFIKHHYNIAITSLYTGNAHFTTILWKSIVIHYLKKTEKNGRQIHIVTSKEPDKYGKASETASRYHRPLGKLIMTYMKS